MPERRKTNPRKILGCNLAGFLMFQFSQKKTQRFFSSAIANRSVFAIPNLQRFRDAKVQTFWDGGFAWSKFILPGRIRRKDFPWDENSTPTSRLALPIEDKYASGTNDKGSWMPARRDRVV